MVRFLGFLALLSLALAAPVRAQPAPVPSPWRQVYPDVYYNPGGVRLPFSVTGGGKGSGSINVSNGYFVNGVRLTGAQAATAPANQFQRGTDNTGTPIFAQPAFSNLSGSLGCGQTPALIGDVTSPAGSCTLTLPNVNAAAGTAGGASTAVTLTTNAKGQVTNVTTNAIAAPAGGLTGSTLASGVIASSLTSVGTIATGVWQGTAISPTYIVTGTSGANLCLLNSVCTFSAKRIFAASTASAASFNIPPGTAPAAPSDGDFWSTTVGFYGRIGGITVGPFTSVSATTPNIFSYNNLQIVASGGAAATVTADRLILPSAGATGQQLSSVNVSCVLGTTGAGGFDNATTLSSLTFYAIYVIYNPTTATTACLFSTSATSPTLPSGYTYYARVGWQKTLNTSAWQYITQLGNTANYIAGSQNQPSITSGIANGTYPTPTVPFTVRGTSGASAVVPPTASQIILSLVQTSSSTASIAVAPNGNYSGLTGAYPPPMAIGTNTVTSAIKGNLLLESNNIYIASQTNTALVGIGWVDNL